MFYATGHGDRWRGEDKLNSKQTRNSRNTTNIEYNCAGYALGSFNWYCPINDDRRACKQTGDIEMFVNQILQDFPNIRVIKQLSDLNKNEYAIAFRLADNDFHFIKRNKSGKWFAKMGGSNIKQYTKDEVFSEKWDEKYDSEIVLFAKVA